MKNLAYYICKLSHLMLYNHFYFPHRRYSSFLSFALSGNIALYVLSNNVRYIKA